MDSSLSPSSLYKLPWLYFVLPRDFKIKYIACRYILIGDPVTFSIQHSLNDAVTAVSMATVPVGRGSYCHVIPAVLYCIT